jgi:hypothetical protein
MLILSSDLDPFPPAFLLEEISQVSILPPDILIKTAANILKVPKKKIYNVLI